MESSAPTVADGFVLPLLLVLFYRSFKNKSSTWLFSPETDSFGTSELIQGLNPASGLSIISHSAAFPLIRRCVQSKEAEMSEGQLMQGNILQQRKRPQQKVHTVRSVGSFL